MDDNTAFTSILNSLRNPSEDIARAIITAAGGRPPSDDDIRRNITTGTGLVAYDLQAPAKNLYPVYTPIRNKLPRRGGGVGTATNWRQVNAIIGSGFDAMGWVPEGQRSGQMSYNTSNKAASFVTLGEEDAATFEAINAGRSFEDIEARMTMRMLQKMMLKEEMGIIFGDNSLLLGTPVAPTLSTSGTGATLPSLTYSVIVVALTGEGFRNSTVTGGVATSKSITGADGKTYVMNGGCSAQSANATLAVTLGARLFASTTAITGAVAYAWYAGAAAAETLQAITTVNSVTFSAPLAGSRQAAAAVTADFSTNATAFDGLYTAACKNAGSSFVNLLPTGVAGTGTTLTATGRGSVVEVDAMMQAMWDTAQVSLSDLRE